MTSLGSWYFAQMVSYYSQRNVDKNQVESRTINYEGTFNQESARHCMLILWWKVQWISALMGINYINSSLFEFLNNTILFTY